jgi:hypothetical protein
MEEKVIRKTETVFEEALKGEENKGDGLVKL